MPEDHPTASTNLLHGIKSMDPDQWQRLVDTFAPVVFRWCRSANVPASDCPDLVQDVFILVARRITNFNRQKPVGSFRSWLATITRNRVRDYLRAVQRRLTTEQRSSALRAAVAPDIDSSISTDSVTNRILERQMELVRKEVQPATWNAFWLLVVQQKPTQDVARATGLSAASVYQAKSRVLRRLRQRLDELPQ